MNIAMPIGQLVLEIRGCLSFLLKDNLHEMEEGFLNEQIQRSRKLIKLYQDTKPSSTSIMQRTWLKECEPEFIELCIIVQSLNLQK